MTDEILKSFILYCQTVEATALEYSKAYYEWKNYWLNQLMSNKETVAFIPHFDTTSYFNNIADYFKK